MQAITMQDNELCYLSKAASCGTLVMLGLSKNQLQDVSERGCVNGLETIVPVEYVANLSFKIFVEIDSVDTN